MTRSLTTALAASTAALALAGSAHAATLLPADIDLLPRGGAIESGQIIVKLSGGAKSKLSSSGAVLKGAGEVSVKGASVSLLADPEADAWLDPTTMTGTVGIDGALSIKGRKGTAKLTKIVFEAGGKGKDAQQVRAKLGSKTIKLGKLTGGKAKFSRQANGDLTGAKLSIDAKAAKRINAVTGGGLSAGAFGTVSFEITTREIPIASGTATMTLDAGILQLLQTNGYALSAEAPAAVNGSNVSLPIKAGAFDPQGLTGRLQLDGKVNVVNASAGKTVPLFNWHTAISDTQKDLYAAFNASGAAAAIGVVDTSQLEVSLDNKTFTAVGAKVTLSKVAVSVLKQSFGITVQQGQPLGTVNLTGTISGVFD
ncbi:MAG: hypothetical protein PGN13_12670 [Patulibacter minatonensis]